MIETKDIKRIRRALGLSQEKFAKPLGVKRSHIGRVENGDAKPSECLTNLINAVYGASHPRLSLELVEAIVSELEYQESKWPGHQHTVGEWILIMDKCLSDAKRAYVIGHGDNSALHEIRQVVAVGVAAMEQCGAPKRGDLVIKRRALGREKGKPNEISLS
jgi:transcriptional regulator with XRE-family HTH domain